ncbi:MAG: hypothetical protein JXM72_05895 [Deltaproteobacteria bacterium]|nr:hypothetical protein [Deltaproteobacteria bacterium]
MKKITVLSLIILILYGCGNDSLLEGFADNSGLEVTLEEAAKALDDGNYQGVVTALSAYYTTTAINPEVARLLASGYMGLAGIDVTNLIAYSYDDPYSISPDPFDMVEATLSLIEASLDDEGDIACNAQFWMVLIFEDDAPYAVFIDGHCIGELIDNLNDAKRIFDKLQNAGLANYDDYVQHGIASAVHYVLFMGNAAAEAMNPYFPGQPRYEAGYVPAPINRDGYQFYKYNANPTAYIWTNITDHTFNEEIDDEGLTPYQRDLIDVNNAVNAIGQKIIQNNLQPKNNSLQNQLDDFLREVLMTDEEDITTSTIISAATTTGILEYISLMSSQGV